MFLSPTLCRRLAQVSAILTLATILYCRTYILPSLTSLTPPPVRPPRPSGRSSTMRAVPGSRPPVLVTVNIGRGGLGNDLFQYASLLGLSRLTGGSHQAVLVAQGLKGGQSRSAQAARRLTTYFPHISATKVKSWPQDAAKTYVEKAYGKNQTEDVLAFLKNSYPHPVLLNAYLQSHHHFSHLLSSGALYHEFTFSAPLSSLAHTILHQTAASHNLTSPTFVGLHIRRGDFLLTQEHRMGRNVAPLSYISRAMSYFSGKYGNVIFIVCSNDLAWSRKNVDTRKYRVYFSNHTPPVPKVGSEMVDMCLLSLCNHTIATVGTFGWWGGLLARGDVVYYSKALTPNSVLDQRAPREEYYPGHWIGMS